MKAARDAGEKAAAALAECFQYNNTICLLDSFWVKLKF